MNIILVAINAKFIHSSLACYSLQAYVGKDKVSVKEFTVNQQEDMIISELYGLRPDVLAFSCYIWNIEMVMSIVRTFKKIVPDVVIVVGGPEVSYEYADLYVQGVDIVVAGEGEGAFKELVDNFLSGQPVPSIYRPEEDAVALRDIPFPYLNGFGGLKNRILYYESSRGCANRCGYCLASTTRGVRFLPMERVKSDLCAFLSAKVRQVKFVDRTFNCKKLHAMDIWTFLIENDNGVSNFHFEIAGEMMDDEMIAIIRKARKGLFQFEIGVQSTNGKSLAEVYRKSDICKLMENIRKLKAIGNTHLHLDLIVGLPYESHASFVKSFNDVMAARPHQLQVGFLKMLKGSGLRKDAAKYGYKFKDNAPYEILENNFMDFKTINKLKKIEHMVELFYNSGGFQRYVEYMFRQFDTPYDFFDALAGYWGRHRYHLIAHKKSALYTILFEFGGKGRLVSELLKFDMLMRENLRTFPEWITAYYRYDAKRMTKTTATHTFEYDVFTYKNGENEVTFDYTIHAKILNKP